MRITFLWTHLSGYLLATLEEVARYGDVQVICLNPEPPAPFDIAAIHRGNVDLKLFPHFPSASEIECLLPVNLDAMVICSWHVRSYRRVARKLRGRVTRVLFMDNPWRGTLRQWVGVAVSRVYIDPLYDLVMLPGDRQVRFAKKLGFSVDDVIRGGYAADNSAYRATPPHPYERRQSFLYAGRLSAEKGIGVLAAAYERYRASAQFPWQLLVAGEGSQANLLSGAPGVQMLGFVQPPMMPSVMQRSGCLILPSLTEPWGVVIHEATCAGLPVIATDACGAVPHLVEDGLNGYVINPGSAESLARAMRRLSEQSRTDWETMSSFSRVMSSRFSPERTAANLVHALTAHQERLRRR
jgi:glycosyltransferase involved in cell wall biosynthesis